MNSWFSCTRTNYLQLVYTNRNPLRMWVDSCLLVAKITTGRERKQERVILLLLLLFFFFNKITKLLLNSFIKITLKKRLIGAFKGLPMKTRHELIFNFVVANFIFYFWLRGNNIKLTSHERRCSG